MYLVNWNCRSWWWPVHILESCSMQAMCGGHHEIFSYASTTGTLQEGSHVGTGWICEHLCTLKGIAKVSLRVSLWALGLARIWKKGNNSKLCTQTWMCRLHFKILQGIAFGSSPYRLPWFRATFKTKEHLTRRLLQQHFCSDSLVWERMRSWLQSWSLQHLAHRPRSTPRRLIAIEKSLT